MFDRNEGYGLLLRKRALWVKKLANCTPEGQPYFACICSPWDFGVVIVAVGPHCWLLEVYLLGI